MAAWEETDGTFKAHQMDVLSGCVQSKSSSYGFVQMVSHLIGAKALHLMAARCPFVGDLGETMTGECQTGIMQPSPCPTLVPLGYSFIRPGFRICRALMPNVTLYI